MQKASSRDIALVSAALVLALAAGSAAFARVRRIRDSVLVPEQPTIYPIFNSAHLETEGLRIGSESAPIRIVEFSDFECPFCATLSRTLDTLRAMHRDSITIVYRHFPIVNKHAGAYPAALAAECAASVGAFAPFHRVLFANRGRLSENRWAELAREAGIRYPLDLARCVKEKRYAMHIERDVRTADSLGLRGTPNVIIGGVRIEGAVSLGFLDSLIRVRPSPTSTPLSVERP